MVGGILRSQLPVFFAKKGLRLFLLCVSILYIGWSSYFIMKSSAVWEDGERYYALFDDYMISMRYGWNLAHGQGLVFNPGERVEGYTNLLVVLIMAGVSLLFNKSYAVLGVHVLGVVVALGTALLAAEVGKSLCGGISARQAKWVGAVIFCGVLSYYPFSYWSLLGLEIGLLTLLFLGAVWLAFQFEGQGKGWYLYGFACLLGLAYLSRPDSVVIGASLWGYLALRIWQKKAKDRNYRSFAIAFFIFLIFPIGQLIFRWFYYETTLPNTYVLKMTGMPLDFRLSNGWGFVKPFLRETSLLILLATITGIVLKNLRIWVLWGNFVALTLYQVFVGGDPWNYWRILTPGVICLILICGVGIEPLGRWAGRGWRLAAVGMLLLIGVGIISPNIRFMPEITFRSLPFDVSKNRQSVRMGLYIAKLTAPTATMAVLRAGTAPYYAGRYTIDVLGKMDPYIASLPPDLSGAIQWNGMRSVPGHNKFDLDYSIKQKMPTVVQSFQWMKYRINDWSFQHYFTFQYDGVTMFLLKRSSLVDWTKVRQYVGE